MMLDGFDLSSFLLGAAVAMALLGLSPKFVEEEVKKWSKYFVGLMFALLIVLAYLAFSELQRHDFIGALAMLVALFAIVRLITVYYAGKKVDTKQPRLD